MKTLYLHKYYLGIAMTPMANCVYDAVVTNNLDIKGHIDKIELIRNQNSSRIIEENLMENYDTLNIEKVNIFKNKAIQIFYVFSCSFIHK